MIGSCDVLQHFLEFCQAYVFRGMLIHNTRSHKHMKIHNKSCSIFIVFFKHPSVVTLLRHHSLRHPAGWYHNGKLTMIYHSRSEENIPKSRYQASSFKIRLITLHVIPFLQHTPKTFPKPSTFNPKGKSQVYKDTKTIPEVIIRISCEYNMML